MSKLPTFKNEQLWLCALTHRSYVNEHPEIKEHNERLEFLGDSVLGFIVSEFLYQRYPEMSEAQLTRLRSQLVDETQLSKLASKLGIGELMRLGKGAIKDGSRHNPALLADTLEAIIGAYFLDVGIEATRQFIYSLFSSVAEDILVDKVAGNTTKLVDIKNRFQEWCLAEFSQNPEYFLIDESGPDHAKEFTYGVRINDRIYGVGKGRRKQDATKAAAAAALKIVGLG
jgi:ribonuclease-3